jgi:hypothetical protein
MSRARTEPRPWRSGFCSAQGHHDWQHAACRGGHSRTPTKADPREWVPCACPRHREPEEHPVTAETFDASLLPDPGPPMPVAAELVALAADRLSTAATGVIESLDWEDCVRLLDTLRDAVRTIQQVDSLLVRQAYLKGPHGKNAAEVDGIGLVSISRSKDRKNWDERGVAQAVIDARMADTTGEAPDPWTVAEWLLEVYGINYVRVTPLRALGLEPEAFCEEITGKPTVQLPPRS